MVVQKRAGLLWFGPGCLAGMQFAILAPESTLCHWILIVKLSGFGFGTEVPHRWSRGERASAPS